MKTNNRNTLAEAHESAQPQQELKEANLCIGLGVGVGALGAIGTAIAGVTCPVCFVVTPVLVTAGLIKRKRLKKVPPE